MTTADRHIPVLLSEVLAHLLPRDGGCYLDATFGAGSYTRGILDAARCTVIALDRDPSAISGGATLQTQYGDRLRLENRPFGSLLEDAEDKAVTLDGLVLDLGVSSMQLDEAERGFSFQSDGPLDMRMSGSAGGEPSAADVVNTADETLIANILYQLGEERRSRAIAAAIVRRREEKPIQRTADLAGIVASVLGRGRPDGKHPATRTFQALRLYVNDELGELSRALAAAEIMLKPGGRLVAVTFHSLEDRIVKQFIAVRAGRTPGQSRFVPQSQPAREQSFRIVNPKPVIPEHTEIVANPRSRSAKLRAAERTEAPAWGIDEGEPDLPRPVSTRRG